MVVASQAKMDGNLNRSCGKQEGSTGNGPLHREYEHNELNLQKAGLCWFPE